MKSYGRTRQVIIPGIAAIVIVWLVQTGIGQLEGWTGLPMGPGRASWIFSVRIPFTHVPIFLHWDMIVAFALAAALTAPYVSYLGGSPKQRYLAAMFPAFFEAAKWLWMLWFPLASWIDPAHQVYRFSTFTVMANVRFWLIHMLLPAAAACIVVLLFNRRRAVLPQLPPAERVRMS